MLINIYIIYLGLVLICLGMDKYYKAVLNIKDNLSYKKLFSLIGSILLGISFFVMLYNEGISLGATYWLGIIAPAISLVALVLTYKAKILPLFSICLFIGVVILYLFI